MSEKNTQVKTPELTQEEIKAIVEKVQAAVIAFNADPRHERYQLSGKNRDALVGYIEAHNLEFTEDALHLAYVELSKSGKLTLFEESKIPISETPKERVVEAALPPISTLAEQQQARRTLDGVLPNKNREAFARAAEKLSNQKISGGRFHL